MINLYAVQGGGQGPSGCEHDILATHHLFHTAQTFDKVNTRMWTGCTSTLAVNFRECWDRGAHQAKVALRRHDVYSDAETDFVALAATAGEDLMRPRGVLAGHSEAD